MVHIKLKKVFLTTLVIALSVSALVGIFILIFQEFGEVQSKIMFTTLSIAGFSITGLCVSIWYDKNKFLFLSYSGIIASILGFIYGFLLIWEIIDNGPFEKVKPFFILIIISVALAHSSLILLAHKEKSLLKIVISITIVSTIIISLMLIGLIIWEWDVEESFYRTLGVFAILVAFGTVSLPILNKIGLLSEK